MSDNLLQKVEEKVMSLLTELEGMRREIKQLQQENASLKAEKQQTTKRLHGLVSLFDTLETAHQAPVMDEREFVEA